MNEQMLDEKREEMIRMSFDIPKSLHTRLKAVIPWGVKSEFMRRTIEHAVARVEKGGAPIIGGIIAGDINPFE